MTIRVLIADDHSVVRQGLQMFLALDLPSRTRAALYALKIGLVSLDEADLHQILLRV
jgi:DNA-binding NarL/FixJ family response regulator